MHLERDAARPADANLLTNLVPPILSCIPPGEWNNEVYALHLQKRKNKETTISTNKDNNIKNKHNIITTHAFVYIYGPTPNTHTTPTPNNASIVVYPFAFGSSGRVASSMAVAHVAQDFDCNVHLHLNQGSGKCENNACADPWFG